MNFQFFQIIKTEVEKTLGKADRFSMSRYKSAKSVYYKKKRTVRVIGDIVFMLLGVFSAGFGLKGFLLPNGFIDGGVTGISLLVYLETKIPLAVLILLINLPFVFIGWTQISRVFVLKTVLAISLLAFVVAFVNYPVVTSDKLLVAVFGGAAFAWMRSTEARCSRRSVDRVAQW